MIKPEYIKPAITAIVITLTCVTGAAMSYSEEKSSGRKFSFLPDARISITPAVTQNENRYTTLSRYLSVDALRYGPLACSFSTYEILNYGGESDTPVLNSIYYNMEYINLRMDTPHGSGSLFIDHRCMNYADRSDPPPMFRWYGYGARWESRGMMIGERKSGHGLNLLSSGDYINFSVSARKPIHTRFYPYDYTADFALRFDYYLTAEIIPYISGSGEIFFSERAEWNRSAECGVRFAYAGADVIPFAGYSHITDVSIADSGKRDFISAGIKVEASMSGVDKSLPALNTTGRMTSLSPELHVRGSYSKYIEDENRNYKSDLLFSLTLLTPENSGIFCNTSLVHSSPQLGNDTGLYPRYIDYYHEAGLSLNIGYNILIEPLYRYTGYGEGNTVEAGGYTYHLAGIRFRTEGMRPGKVNSRVLSRFTGSFATLLNTEAELIAGWIPDIRNEKDCLFIEGTLREDLFSYKSAAAYLSVNARIEKPGIPGDEGTAREIKPECGLRFNSELVLMLFYQYIRRNSGNIDYDINSEYHLAGVRIDI